MEIDLILLIVLCNIYRPLNEAGEQIRMPAYNCSTTAEMLQLYFQCNMYGSLTHVATGPSGMPIKEPFPMELFDDRVRTKNGWFDDFPGKRKITYFKTKCY